MQTQIVQQHNGKINIVFQSGQSSHNIEEADASVTDIEALQFIDEKLAPFIGLRELKTVIKEIFAYYVINEKRKAVGFKQNEQMLHMIFSGNPGTGKTTIARTLAHLLHDVHVLSKGHFIEVERADLVGEYIGQTAQKTRAVIQKALGGVLFIDEAYALARGGHRDFGKEAIDTLVKQLEDYRDDIIVILAGYPNEMEHFLEQNPGLASRFPVQLEFMDYQLDELLYIAEHFAKEKQYELSVTAKEKLRQHLQMILAEKQAHFANARYVRNLIEKSMRTQAIRLLKHKKYELRDLLLITAPDIVYEDKY